MSLQSIVGSLINQAGGIFGVDQPQNSPVSSLTNDALGIFSGQIPPSVAYLGNGISSMVIPQNTSGLGIFGGVMNPNPVASLGNSSLQLTAGGAKTIAQGAMQQILNVPPVGGGVSGGTQAASMPSSSQGNDNTVLIAAGAWVVGKVFKLW